MAELTKKRVRILGWILFFFYLLLLFYFLFFAEAYGRSNWFQADFRYNLKPFGEIYRFWKYKEQLGFRAVFLNLAGNIIAFMPLGFIMPVVGKNFRSFRRIVLLGAFFSLLVECAQLLAKVGCFDVDDLILNTLGTIFGYLVFALCDLIRRR